MKRFGGRKQIFMKWYLLGGGSRPAEAASALLEFTDDLTGGVPISRPDPFSGSSEENKTVTPSQGGRIHWQHKKN